MYPDARCLTSRGEAEGGGNGVGGVVDGYGDSVRKTGGWVLGIGRDCNVASAFSAAQSISLARLQIVNARVHSTFLEESELYCT